MNAEQIRETITREEAKGIPSQAGDYWLREIAAQLAELNEHLKAMRGSTPVPPRDPEAHLPEECRKHECSYYTHYLVYGGPDLTHEGFHNAEKQADAHFKSCPRTNNGKECPVCFNWEKRVRA